LRLFSFGGYGLALAALALVVSGAIECPPKKAFLMKNKRLLAVSRSKVFSSYFFMAKMFSKKIFEQYVCENMALFTAKRASSTTEQEKSWA